MAVPVVIAKNQTGSDIPLSRLGQVVPASGQTTLTDFATYIECTQDESLAAAVLAGDLIINDGAADLSVAEALVYIDSSGNLDGPATGAAANVVLKLSGASGKKTLATGVTIDASNNITTPGTITATAFVGAGGTVTPEGHKALRQLIHFIDGGPADGFGTGPYYFTQTPAGPFPTQETWFTSNGGTAIVRLNTTWNGNRTIASEEWIMYDTDGSTVLVRLTDTHSYSGIYLTNTSRAVAFS